MMRGVSPNSLRAIAIAASFTLAGALGANASAAPNQLSPVTAPTKNVFITAIIGTPTTPIVQRAIAQTLIDQVGAFLDTVAEITSVFDIPIPLAAQKHADLRTLDQ